MWCLTEFGLIIRLVYLWFAPADRLHSWSEGVFPLQKQISPLISRWAPGSSWGISIDQPGSVSCISSAYLPLVEKIIFPFFFPRRSLCCISEAGEGERCECHWCGDGNESPALLKPAPGQSIKALFEYSHGSANRRAEWAVAAVTRIPSN